MDHKLLIEFELEYRSEFLPYLGVGEVIRGDFFKVALWAMNLGTSKFPGVEVSKLSIDFRPQGVAQSRWRPSFKVSCPQIEAGKRVRFFSEDVLAIDEGTAWVHVEMKAEDGDTIEYYQTPNDRLEDKNEWINCMYVVSRESIHMIALLDQLVKRMK